MFIIHMKFYICKKENENYINILHNHAFRENAKNRVKMKKYINDFAFPGSLPHLVVCIVRNARNSSEMGAKLQKW